LLSPFISIGSEISGVPNRRLFYIHLFRVVIWLAVKSAKYPTAFIVIPYIHLFRVVIWLAVKSAKYPTAFIVIPRGTEPNIKVATLQPIMVYFDCWG